MRHDVGVACAAAPHRAPDSRMSPAPRSPPASRACRRSCSRSRRRPSASTIFASAHALLRSPAGIVLDREAHEQRLVRRPVRAHALDDLDAEAHAVQLASRHTRRCAGWRTARGTGGSDSRARRAFEHVEARLVRAPRRLAPALDHLGISSRVSARGIGSCLGALHARSTPPAPSRPSRRSRATAASGAAALPRPEAPRLAAGMAELDAGDRVLLADELDAALERPGRTRRPRCRDRRPCRSRAARPWSIP